MSRTNNIEMTKEDKGELVVKQIFIGLGGGLLGAILSGSFESLFFKLTSLFASIMYMLIGGYLGMFIAIGVVGYLFLKEHGRQKNFIKFILQSLFGLIISLLVFYYAIGKSLGLPNALINFLIVAFSLTAIILSFNYGLRKEKRGSHRDNG